MRNCLKIVEPDLQNLMFLICKLLRNIYTAVNKSSMTANSKRFEDRGHTFLVFKAPCLGLFKVTHFYWDPVANMNFIVFSFKIKSRLPQSVYFYSCVVAIMITRWQGYTQQKRNTEGCSTKHCYTINSTKSGVFKLWYGYAEGCQVVCHKVYKNIKLENQKKQPFLLVRYREQRSEYMTPFTTHSGLRTLEINLILYDCVLLCYETLSERSIKPSLQMIM